MYLGRIVEIGLTEDILNRPIHPYTKALMDSIPKMCIRDSMRPDLEKERLMMLGTSLKVNTFTPTNKVKLYRCWYPAKR